jgi:hypothetical protein
MLKKAFYSLLALSLIAFLSCDKKLALISIGRDITIAVEVNALSTGQTFNKTIDVPSADIKEALRTKGGSNIQLEKLIVEKVSVTIPDTTAWTFANIESVNVSIDGNSVGTLPAGSTGKTIVFAVPSTFPDLKTNISNGTPFNLNVVMKAKNATTAAKLTVVFTFNIDASLSL